MRLLLLSLLLLTIAACEKDELLAPPAMAPNGTADTTLTYLALGDSYTIGTSVQPREAWPAQLALQLDREVGTRVELTTIARNGWRTDNLSNALDAADPGDDFDLVTLLIGVNDQYQSFSASGYRTRFADLLDRAIGYAGGNSGRVLVVSIPDYAYTPFGAGDPSVSRSIDAFNEAAQLEAVTRGVTFRSITQISRDGLDDPSLVAGDGLHPSAKQYARWVDEVLLAQVRIQLR